MVKTMYVKVDLCPLIPEDVAFLGDQGKKSPPINCTQELITVKTHIVTKEVVGLLLGEVVSTKIIAHRHRGCGWLEVVSTKKKHIVAKDVVGLQVGDDDSLTKIKTY